MEAPRKGSPWFRRCLPGDSFVVPFWVVCYITPNKNRGHNQKGTTLESPGRLETNVDAFLGTFSGPPSFGTALT